MIKLIEDLGMLETAGGGPRKRRYGIYACVECGSAEKSLTQNVKAKGYFRCAECGHKSMINKKIGMSIRHGDAGKFSTFKALYHVYHSMVSRCTNVKDGGFENYGGRGISVCREWVSSYVAFKKWALSHGYKRGLTIDRADNDGSYNPENCRWVGMGVQAANQRKRKTNTSGYTGVRYVKRESRWLSTITVNYNEVYIGHFDSAIDGAIAREKYIISHSLPHRRNFTNGRVSYRLSKALFAIR